MRPRRGSRGAARSGAARRGEEDALEKVRQQSCAVRTPTSARSRMSGSYLNPALSFAAFAYPTLPRFRRRVVFPPVQLPHFFNCYLSPSPVLSLALPRGITVKHDTLLTAARIKVRSLKSKPVNRRPRSGYLLYTHLRAFRGGSNSGIEKRLEMRIFSWLRSSPNVLSRHFTHALLSYHGGYVKNLCYF